MSRARTLGHLVRADFLERVRRYSFLFTLGFALYLGYAAATGRIVLQLGLYRGVFNSAWTGAVMTSIATSFLTLAGFYFVKNTIERDRQTGVGQILAATPLSKPLYVLGKTLSNFLVLVTMMGLLVPIGLLTQLQRGEERHIDLWAFLTPFLLLAVPTMMFIAALAVLFETVPLLHGGFGNVLYFFFWASLPAIAVQTKHAALDQWGLVTIWQSAGAVAREKFPEYDGRFFLRLDVGDSVPAALHTFRWEGLRWSNDLLAARFVWVVAAMGLVLLAATFFDRFDLSRENRMRRIAAPQSEAVPELRGSALAAHLTVLPAAAATFHFGQMVVAELRLMLKGQKWWWYIVAAGLFVACVASPLAIARRYIFPFAWIWPVLLWSAMGAREVRCQTYQLVFSAAHSLRRQLPALWVSGVVVALLTGGGIAIRLLLAGDRGSALGWLVGAFFIPTLALACGTWSGSSKLFEILYTLLWYAGPLQPTRQLDFMAASPQAVATGTPWFYFLATLLLAGLALLGRRRQLQV